MSHTYKDTLELANDYGIALIEIEKKLRQDNPNGEGISLFDYAIELLEIVEQHFYLVRKAKKEDIK